mmetsp:Transcript_32911/g.55159  ORF Transcript_32911/g.55159 Transcript_32911/m.55159 type:complete len:85 (+) Transcript_32911:2162-2416(+)
MVSPLDDTGNAKAAVAVTPSVTADNTVDNPTKKSSREEGRTIPLALLHQVLARRLESLRDVSCNIGRQATISQSDDNHCTHPYF